MIDIFEPHAAFEREKFPLRTDEHKAELQAFLSGVARPDVATEKLVKFGQVLRTGGAKKVGAYGLCWGRLSVGAFLAWKWQC
jgi:dienelactone hydrolase